MVRRFWGRYWAVPVAKWKASWAKPRGWATKIGPLLTMLAPLVLQFLSQRAGNLDAASVGQLLGQETARVPQPGGLAGGLLGGLLDQNGDGKLDAGDLFKLGAGLFSKR